MIQIITNGTWTYYNPLSILSFLFIVFITIIIEALILAYSLGVKQRSWKLFVAIVVSNFVSAVVGFLLRNVSL